MGREDADTPGEDLPRTEADPALDTPGEDLPQTGPDPATTRLSYPGMSRPFPSHLHQGVATGGATQYEVEASRFRILHQEYAKGARGVIHVAFDEELRREVALKVIQRQYEDDPSTRYRFLLEAEI